MVLALPNVRSSEHPTKLEAESQNLMLIAKAASAMKTTKKTSIRLVTLGSFLRKPSDEARCKHQ